MNAIIRFRSGKAVTSTWGAWSALTVPFGPAVIALGLLALDKLVDASGWAVMGARRTCTAR